MSREGDTVLWMKQIRKNKITAVHLAREGDCAVVKIERDGQWLEVIRERYDGAFSHIKNIEWPSLAQVTTEGEKIVEEERQREIDDNGQFGVGA